MKAVPGQRSLPRAASAPRAKEMSKLDAQIMNLLVANGRITNKMLAENLGASESVVGSRVRRLIASRTIKPIMQRDIYFLGYSQIYMLEITTHPGAHRSVAEALFKFDEVMSVTAVLGEHQLTVMIMIKDRTHLDEFLSREVPTVDGILSINAQLCTNIRKYEARYGAVEL